MIEIVHLVFTKLESSISYIVFCDLYIYVIRQNNLSIICHITNKVIKRSDREIKPHNSNGQKLLCDMTIFSYYKSFYRFKNIISIFLFYEYFQLYILYLNLLRNNSLTFILQITMNYFIFIIIIIIRNIILNYYMF